VGPRRAPLRFIVEAALLVAVGVALAAADVELLPFVVVMALAWVLIATAERVLVRAVGAAGDVEPPPISRAPTPAPSLAAAEPKPGPVEQREPEPQRALEAVPPEPESRPEPEPEEEEAEPEEEVLELPQAAHRRPEGWNLWDLELRARQVAGADRLRDEEWNALFVSLREYAQPDGTLPPEFDPLVHESFEELISRRA
jgi:hypothetical protein